MIYFKMEFCNFWPKIENLRKTSILGQKWQMTFYQILTLIGYMLQVLSDVFEFVKKMIFCHF